MTPAQLRTYTSKALAQMARQAGVAGWHSMRKEELVAALSSRKSTNGKPTPVNAAVPRKAVNKARRNGTSKVAKLREQQLELDDLSKTSDCQSDRLIILVRDPYWLHVCWELTQASVARAKTALGQDWYGSKPMLRVCRLADDGSVLSERRITIHGGVSHWYVDVANPPARYRAEIGYAGTAGKFYCLARSNEVETPAPGAAEAIDDNWSDVARNADRVYAMSGGYTHGGASRELREVLEERLRRRLGRPTETRFGGPGVGRTGDAFGVEVDAELIVYGNASPLSHLTVQGEPVALQPNGSFAVKVPFPDRRQVIPVVASSPDGVQQKTVILGVERNTKQLEPRRRDAAGS